MFSSEQRFEVSGDRGQLDAAIKFAVNMYGNSCKSYQISKDGKYCLGWTVDEENGWNPFPFDFDAHIVSEIVKQHLDKQDYGEDPYDWCDGGSGKGFLMKVIDQTFSDEKDGIKRPFYGIVSIEPFWNYYAK